MVLNRTSNQGITIIIPTYNRSELLSVVVATLQKQLQACDEILLIIDPADNSNTIDSLKSIKHTLKLRIYLGKKNNNVSSLRNMGIRLSKNEYIAFLDDDCIPSPSYLECIRKIVLSSKSEEVFQGKCTNELKGNTLYTAAFSNTVNFHNYYYRNSKNFIAAPIQHLLAGNFFLKKSILQKYRISFNEIDFPTVGEQLDISYKFQLKSIKLVNAPSVRVTHIKYEFGIKRLFTRNYLEGYVEKRLDYQYGANQQVKQLFARNIQNKAVSKLIKHIRYSIMVGENYLVILLVVAGYFAHFLGFIKALIEEHIGQLLRGLHLSQSSHLQSK